MTERAKHFVESWIREYVHPATVEAENHHSKSRASAIACLYSAEVEGISKKEVEEEYTDLVAYMAKAYERSATGEADLPM